MDAYSLDLRKKIVEAKERGMPTIEVAKTFGVGVSTVKRYAATAREGRSLTPKKRPGSKPKMDEAARRLLERDMQERPAATLPQRREFLRRASGGWRLATLRTHGCSSAWDGAEKKIGGCERARRVLEGSLARDGCRGHRARAFGLCRRDGHQHLANAPLCLVA